MYDPAEFAAVEHVDRPDFFVYSHGPDKPAFGVEITEVYDDESNARLQNIEGYFEDLIAGKPHRHRDDVETLKVETIQLRSKEGVLRDPITVVLQDVSTKPDLPTLIAGRIRDKDARAADYERNLSHINLVILDRTDRLATPPNLDEEFPITTFLSPDLRTALSDSSFHEVHLVARDKEGGEVVRGLRSLTMVEAAYMFVEAVKSTVGLPFDCSDEDGHLLFIGACERRGLKLDYLADDHGIRAQFGGISVQFTESGIRIIDGHLVPRDPPSDKPDLTVDTGEADRIFDEYLGFATSHVFSCAWGSAPVQTFAQSRRELGIIPPGESEV